MENSGAVGAAVYLKPLVSHALSDFKINALFYNCSFSRNQVVNTKSRLESGIMNVESFQIDFLNYVSFNDNTASAIYSESAIINILQGTQIQFVNNTAINGGAMSLHGSIFEIHPSSQFIFYSNCAKEHGGAIYAPLPQETEFGLPPVCFLPVQGKQQFIFTVCLTGRQFFTTEVSGCRSPLLYHGH